MARKYPLSDVASNSDALNVDYDIVGVTPRHLRLGPNDARVATRKPLVDDMELDNTSSDVDSNIGSCTERIKVNDLGDGNVPDVGSDIGSPIEQVKANGCINLEDCDVSTSARCLVSMTKTAAASDVVCETQSVCFIA